MNKQHLKWLTELTAIPSAAGREFRVIDWVERWARRRRNVVLHTDRFGNLTLSMRGVKPATRPLYFTAHMDHPAFVVSEVLDARHVRAEFRGGVANEYFEGSKVLLHTKGAAGKQAPTSRGVIEELVLPEALGPGHDDKRVTVRFPRSVNAVIGDVMTWDIAATKVKGRRLHALACDNLAGLAAALASFDNLLKDRTPGKPRRDVRLLLTRAEEVGFIGAMAACRSGAAPKRGRFVVLENTKAFPDAPVGGGPIVRVGDRVSTFDPALTGELAEVAGQLATGDASFKWQRKLMTGGACEATAFQVLGRTATCACLPVDNMHNMDTAKGRIAPESVSLDDFAGLVRLLTTFGAAKESDGKGQRTPSLATRLDELYQRRRSLLG